MERKTNTKVTKKHYDRWITYIYSEHSDKNKYGHGLDSQQVLGMNQYPYDISQSNRSAEQSQI